MDVSAGGWLSLWQAIHWQSPHWLWLVPLGLVVLLAYEALAGGRLMSLAWQPFRRAEAVIRHPAVEVLAELQGRNGPPGRRFEGLFRYLGYAVLLSLLAAALAQPYQLGKRLPQPSPYREVVFLLDTSVSMVLRDYQVDGERLDRMSMLKGVMHHFVNALKGNRLGIIAFSESAYTLVPLTRDYHLLLTELDRLRPAVLTGRTTRLSQALLYAGSALSRGRDAHGKRPLLVLISDVQRPFRDIDPRVVAEQLHRRGYTLHTIALGAASDAAAESAGQGLIYQAVNFPLLKALAQRGGGSFYWARDVDSLQQAIQRIQQSGKRQVSAAPRYRRLALYHWPLMAALLFLLSMQAVAVVRKR